MSQVWPLPPVDTGWVDLTLENGWTVQNARTPQVRRVGSTIRLRGQVGGGTLGATTFQLPQWARTSMTELHSVATAAAGGYLQVPTSGACHLAGGATYWSLAGVAWMTDQPA